MKRSNVLTFIVKIRGKILLLGRETIIGKQKAVCPTFVSTFFFTLNFRIYFWSSLCPFSYGYLYNLPLTPRCLRFRDYVLRHECVVYTHTHRVGYIYLYLRKSVKTLSYPTVYTFERRLEFRTVSLHRLVTHLLHVFLRKLNFIKLANCSQFYSTLRDTLLKTSPNKT